ncbi:hypothetical protein [Psychrobacter sp. DAB_AL62B]|uniref:hypothetical protein n=1 Tax=Psychrobacter sp. DAB_AL62B TaxID=1028420 RepID=UPI002380E930|nr:hypothetical protein [Psychrobacter sp. DAB_AL62B]MDE4453969.1 hypothetical protein [Psychrobacter sp. DAB_AL62B]
MNHPYPIAKRYKQLLLALIYSPIIAYLINAYFTYQSFKKHDEDLTVSIPFLISIAEYMQRDIELTFFLFGIIPFFLPLPIFYLFVFYKTLTSKKAAVEKHRMPLLTLLLVLFYLFTKEFTSIIASSI